MPGADPLRGTILLHSIRLSVDHRDIAEPSKRPFIQELDRALCLFPVVGALAFLQEDPRSINMANEPIDGGFFYLETGGKSADGEPSVGTFFGRCDGVDDRESCAVLPYMLKIGRRKNLRVYSF